MKNRFVTFGGSTNFTINRLYFKEDVGGFNSNYYMVEGLNIVTRKRREHLTSEDIKKNKALIQEFATGVFRKGSSGDDNDVRLD